LNSYTDAQTPGYGFGTGDSSGWRDHYTSSQNCLDIFGGFRVRRYDLSLSIGIVLKIHKIVQNSEKFSFEPRGGLAVEKLGREYVRKVELELTVDLYPAPVQDMGVVKKSILTRPPAMEKDHPHLTANPIFID